MRNRILPYQPALAVLLCVLSLALWNGDGTGAALSAEVRNPDGVAVIIGNRDYAHRDVPEVSFAHRDADAFRRYVVDVLGFDPENIIDLRDATQSEMEAAFGNERSHEGVLWRYLNPDGGAAVVVFYSGHGVPGLKDGRGYLLPADANPNTAEINGYPIDLLYGNLAKLGEAASVWVFLDACFSGSSHRGMLVRAASPASVTPSLPAGVAERVTLLTAASGDQVASWDEEAGHGLFTHHLLDALYGGGDGDGDGAVTAQEAKAYLDRHMTRAARKIYGRHQRADLREAGDVVLAAAPADGAFLARPALGDPDPALDRTAGDEGGEDGADPARIVLADGYTVADWALLAEVRLERGEHTALLAEANRHIREHGPLAPLEENRERAIVGLVADIPLSTKAAAREALTRIAKVAASAGERPDLLGLEARAHRLLGDYSSAAAAYGRWLQAAPQSHPERRDVLSALAQARLVVTQSAQFSELLGRPFSADTREGGVDWTDLHYAAALNLPGVVTALIDGGMAADVPLKTGSLPFGDDLKRTLTALGHEEFKYRRAYGQTSLMIAAMANAREAAEFLVAKGADIKATDNSGNTPLHFAAYMNARETAEFLIAKGADIKAKDISGETPLHGAALGNARETAEFLLAKGADIEAMDNYGRTPLHFAAYMNARETVEWLVDRGADINATNGSESPLDYALRTTVDDEESRAATQALLRRLGGKTAEELK